MMDRPKNTDEYIAKAAAEDLLPELMAWADADERERGRYLSDAREVMRGAFWENGYELARRMERRGYEPDARLVEILEGASSLLSDRYQAAVKEWVKGWNIKVPWAIGQMVRVKYRGKEVAGEVVSIKAEEAVCVIHCPSLGHQKNALGAGGLVVNSEEVLPELVTA